MQWEAITWQRMAERLAGRLDDPDNAPGPGTWQRVGIDGAPAADTASLRFEYGRQDVDAYLDGWYDTAALWREVFGPTDPGGTGRVLPDLWDPVTDRATRSPYVELPAAGVLLVHGPLLLGRWFPFDLSVHVRLSAGALARRTEESERWTGAAFARYEAEADPASTADVVVRADDPRHPAWTGFRKR
ncbi:nucleoside/nucleotide kinase family protein [Streptomyces amritsarensis]|uniref:uridine kinase n=1 Tax=Streptomyces amritsarensis TaxID=681158 RepID=UPI0036BAB74A